MKDEPGPSLPAPLTLRLYKGTSVVFTSEKRWLHPLFDLEAFFAATGLEPGRTRLVDRVTGRAAAFLVARLGIRDLETLVLSRRALPVLEAHGIRYRCGVLVDRITCATEDLLEETLDLDAAWAILQEQRSRSAARQESP